MGIRLLPVRRYGVVNQRADALLGQVLLERGAVVGTHHVQMVHVRCAGRYSGQYQVAEASQLLVVLASHFLALLSPRR